MRVIFFGTPSFAADHLKALVEANVEVVAIVTKPDRPQGRSLRLQPTAVKVVAQQLLPEVPIFQPEKCSTPDFIEILARYSADLYVVVAYGEIIKQAVLDLPRLGCINVHASLLPRYRGAAPIQRALIHGEHETGISIIKLVLKMDAGDVIAEEKIPITSNMIFKDLEEQLCQVGCRVLLRVIADYEKGCVVAVAQDESKVSFANKITTNECKIDWNQSALTIHNLIRGLSPHPGAWCEVTVHDQKKRLKILRSQYDPTIMQKPGMFILNQNGKNGFWVACGEGGILLEQVQLEGKQVMPIHELLKGTPLCFQ